jgi:regulatory protein
MEPHGRSPEHRESARATSRQRRRDRSPLDGRWLERQALDYLARTEAPRRAVEEALKRRLRARGERTGEDVTALFAEVAPLVSSLVDRGYVDDARYARQRYARARREGRSRARILADLHSKGIDPETLEAIEAEQPHGAAETEELAAAVRTARRRRLGPFHPEATERTTLRDRHLGVLARGGFSREVATRVVDGARDALEAILETATR